ncbi:MAG: hypothetical protein AB8G16_00335 [Gammaproteobacteria bacterium]
MTNVGFSTRSTSLVARLTLALLMCMAISGQAHAADKVTTFKDDNGWKLLVNGEDYYIKGIVWSYSPRGQNYSYNLWGESDEKIRAILDYDFALMQAAGVNTIRSFMMLPPKWVTYVYETYGIRTVINPLMGRYGYLVGGRWIPNTDYSDPLTRATLKKDMLDIVNTYKDVPGVLMFAFGNESNYGLSWSSFEIENLPEGERNTEKARYLYSLFNEVMKAGKSIAPNHPFTIVNGDIQYIDLIAEYCTDMDLLGSNVYRGKSFTSLWEEVDKKLDMPVVFFEFGSDAFNAREGREDGPAQAGLLRDQWQEMYNKSYGNGEEGNSSGGFVFEWRDEWWKYLQEENLEVHDDNASWSNQGYPFDWAPGQNNMNEEWFGIVALGLPNADGVYEARPRMAYDVLSEIFHMDPYEMKKDAFNQKIATINMDYLELKSDVREIKSKQVEDDQVLKFAGGSLLTRFVLKGTENAISESGENGVEFSDGQLLFMDFEFKPTEKIDGQFTVNVLGDVADLEPLEIVYGRRGLPVQVVGFGTTDQGVEVQTVQTFTDRERVEIYDFEAKYVGEDFDVTAFYHTPRYHWKYKGDFFGLVREATDIYGADIWNAKAPEGVEFVGKGRYEGLTILGGPEVYWGANPKVVGKYSSKFRNTDWTFIHSEDVSRLAAGVAATLATVRQSRQTTLYTKTPIGPAKLELGAMLASGERVGDQYDRVVRGNILLDEIDFEDTIALRTRFTFPFLGTQTYIATNHAGLVAEGGDVLREFGTRLPYSNLGNTEEYEMGMMMNFGNLMIFPRLLYRQNLVDANPNLPSSIENGVLMPGIAIRDRDADPFAVLGNREARAAELFITYDPTGATPFYQWDNDQREDAGFAFNLGLNYTEYPTPTDANQFFFELTRVNASFGVGLPPEDVWEASSRMVFNPNRNTRIITNLSTGFQQSSGDPNGGSRKFYALNGKMVVRNKHYFEGYFKKDAWGPYDFHRQFNITFPEQVRLEYSVLLDSKLDFLRSTKLGVRTLYRTLDENSPDNESENGTNDYIFQTVFFFRYNF